MMMFEYRNVGVEGVEKLLWITKDSGAFGSKNSGPLGDWIQGKQYFLKYVKNKVTVLQAGGNCGMYPLFYSKYFENVITFEPDDNNFHCLKENCKNIPNIKYIQGGLGNTTNKLSLEPGPDYNVGMHIIKNEPGNIQMYRVDDLKLENLDLLHLDIEGYETEALKGAKETIKKYSPVIITERSHGFDVIEGLGYSPVEILQMDTVFIREFY